MESRAKRVVMRFVGRIVSIGMEYVSKRTLPVNTRISSAMEIDAYYFTDELTASESILSDGLR